MKLHVGLTPWSLRDTLTAQEIASQAAFAEDLGYQSFWLPESHFSSGFSVPDPLMVLASVATATKTIRLGTTSYLLPLRRPLLAAEQVAVLDQLSSGRVILGIGRGYAPQLFDTFGVDRSKKRQLLLECLNTMKAAWLGELEGGESSVSGTTPSPVQKPHPPIWVAAFGPKALRQAGALGCPYLASPGETLQKLSENYAVHRQACLDNDLPIPTEVPVMRTMLCSNDSSLVRDLRDRLTDQSNTNTRVGRESTQPNSVDDWCIVGDQQFVRDKVQEYQEEVGLNHLVVTRLRIGGVSSDVLRHSLELIAEILI